MASTSTDRLVGITTAVAVKAPVKVMTTADITLSGEQTIDTVSVVTDDRVLVANQDTASENGIYKADSGAWARAADFDGVRDVRNGTMVLVTDGGSGTDNLIYRTIGTDPIDVGTDSITFATFGVAGATGAAGTNGAAGHWTATPPSAITLADGDEFTVYDVGSGDAAGVVTAANVQAYLIAKAGAWTAQQTFTEATLTDQATIAWAVGAAQHAKVTLAGNRTLANATGIAAGGFYSLRVIQDGTGSRTLSYGAAYLFGDAGAPTFNTAAASEDIMLFRSDGTNLQYLGTALGVDA